MNIRSLKIEFIQTLSYIPDFIDTTSSIDYTTWQEMCFISDILLQLVSDKIINESKITHILNQYEMELDMIIDINREKYIKVVIFFIRNLEYMLERTIEEEIYESATNIRNFVSAKNKNTQTI